MGKRLEAILALDNPAPADLDPESLAQDSLLNHSSPISDDEHDFSLARAHYLNITESKLRASIPVELNQKLYQGRKVSRATLYKDLSQPGDLSHDSNSDDTHDNSNNGLNDDMSDEEDDASSGISDDAEDLNQDNESTSANAIDEIQHSDESSNSQSVSEDDDASMSDYSDTKDEQELEQEREIEQEIVKLGKEERKLVQQMSESAQSGIAKGRHCLYDSILDMRIRLQQGLAIANKLPHPDNYTSFAEDNQHAIAATQKHLTSFIHDLLDFKINLFQANKHVAPKTQPTKRKRSEFAACTIDDIWHEIEQLEDSFLAPRTEIIDKWCSKIKSAGTGGSLRKLKAVNITTNAQIQNLLADPDRLVKRTQLWRSTVAKTAASNGLEAKNINTNDDEYDQEIFDDEDFYSMLLKDFIESKANDAGDDPIALSLKALEIRKLTRNLKKKKGVDTKASKGRKIRYNVHEKLVGFMTSIPVGTWHDEMTRELFHGLFAIGGGGGGMGQDDAADSVREGQSFEATALKIFK